MITYEKMKIPELKISKREREYGLYNEEERDEIIYRYLFKGESHRKLDKKVLGIDSKQSRGWQSMGVLHHLGINNDFKGIFKEYEPEEAIKLLSSDGNEQYLQLIRALERYNNKQYIHNKTIDLEEVDKTFDRALEESMKLSDTERRNRLKAARKKPKKISVTLTNYERNPDVVIEVLKRANGICEGCKREAPFIRKSNNTPYLEVHHVIPLSQDGEDTVENAVALCPNCHRKIHFGINANWR